MSGEIDVDFDRIYAIAARLDLRPPNREALESIAIELSWHYDVDQRPSPFRGVVDSATGMGKTWIMAAAIEYLAGAIGIRNFAVITPGKTILEKTVANFTRAHRKSLLGPMEVEPVVVTADNFNTSAMRSTMDDDTRTKLFVFTVQALTKPTTKVGKRTHKFQEGLGEAFYDHLRGLDDLVVFADEHHAYFGKAFAAAVNDLDPYALLGLTATPHRQTPESEIIYRYPLAAAIADRWVKTPVIVGRKDDRADIETKLADGIKLLNVKAELAAAYSEQHTLAAVHPVMLVVASTIDEAEEVGEILRSTAFDGGRWADSVLVVHSDGCGSGCSICGGYGEITARWALVQAGRIRSLEERLDNLEEAEEAAIPEGHVKLDGKLYRVVRTEFNVGGKGNMQREPDAFSVPLYRLYPVEDAADDEAFRDEVMGRWAKALGLVEREDPA